MEEIWKDCVDFPGYKISNLGKVLGLKGWVLSPCKNHAGYASVKIKKGDSLMWKPIAHLVLDAFVGSRPDGLICRHLNGVRDDNRACNLTWGTKLENESDKIEHGTCTVGEDSPRAKLTKEQVLYIRKNYWWRPTNLSNASELAEKFGVGINTITNVVSGRTYKFLSAADLVR